MGILDLTPSDFRLEAGVGEASFPMNRGSFKYQEKLSYKKSIPATEENVQIRREGNRLFLHVDFGSREYNRFWITFPVGKGEHFYGCGETFSEFDLKGQKVRIWVAEHQNAYRISKKIIRQTLLGKRPDRKQKFLKYESYYVQPTFVSSAKYYVHVDGDCYMEFDFRKEGFVTLYMRGSCDVEIGAADSFSGVSELLSETLGRQQAIPDWLYEGIILGMQGGTEIIDGKLALAKKHGVPVKGIWCQDWCGCRRNNFGYQVMWNWRWEEELYPGLKERIGEWKKEGIRFLGYINPFLAIEKELYAYASGHGYCVKDKEGRDYLVTITVFPAAMIDFTNPEAYAWYKNLIKENMIDLGMGGWMADFGEYLPPDCVLYSGEDPKQLHNRWPAIWARMNREALRERGVENEVFFFTRAGYTETIKYSTMMWNGDQHVDWSVDDGLPSVIPATLSLAMSGYGITHSDAGGYTTIMNMTRQKELLMRWEEMNVFTPLMRTHEGNQPSRNVQYDADDELLEHLAKMTKLHVTLSDYLKACVKEEIDCGTPVMRPLFYHYDEEKAYTEMTEYLLGRDLLVAPILKEKATSRTVYLPQDEWVHFFTRKEYAGGEHLVEAPIGQPPVFIRKRALNKF